MDLGDSWIGGRVGGVVVGEGGRVKKV
jgi:hypothetical protein